MFKDRLKKAMKDLHLNQVQVSGMTGKSRASISQYLSGAQVPPDAVQRSMAAALGLDVEYFTAPDEPQSTDPVPKRHGGIRQLSLKDAATLLGVDKETVGKGLQQGVFPWGYGVKTSPNRWRYIINADRFSQIEGVAIEEGELA